MATSLTEFIAKYDGKGIDEDGSYGYQCVDLVMQYSKEVLGIPRWGSGNAIGRWTNYPTETFDKIEYVYGSVPQSDDVVIWGTLLGPYGHIAVAIAGNADSFTSFDQNYPIGSLCHKQPHNYKGVLGWLRPKIDTSPPPADNNGMTPEEVKQENFKVAFATVVNPPHDPNSDEYQAFNDSGKDPAAYVRDKYLAERIAYEKSTVVCPSIPDMTEPMNQIASLQQDVRDLEGRLKACQNQQFSGLSLWSKIKLVFGHKL